MIKYFIYAYLLVVVISWTKPAERITDMLSRDEKNAALTITEYLNVDYKHVCYGCEIRYKGNDRIEYWKNNRFYWADILIGSGFGSISKTSMAGAPATNPGDRLLIVPGNYVNITLTNLNNLTIAPQTLTTHTVFTSGTISMNNNNNLDVGYISSIGASTAFTINGGNNQFVRWHHIYIKNCAGSCWQFGNNRIYTFGNNASAQMYGCSFDSIYVSKIGQIMTGAFASITASGGPYDVVDSINVTNVHLDSVTNQDQIQGVYVHAHFDNIINLFPQTSTFVTDKGFFQCGDGSGGWGNFQGTVSRYYQSGGRGKIGRFHVITFHTGSKDSSIFSNSGKFNTTNYGGIDIYNSVSGGTIAGQTQGASWMSENITCGNMTSINPFPTAIMWIGPSNAGQGACRNLLAFNNFIDGNGNIYNSSGGTWIVDTLKCWRYASAAAAGLDATGTNPTYKPFTSSPVVGQGIRVNLITDFAGVAYSNPPVIGYLMASGSPPPPPAGCNCLPGRAGYRKVFLTTSLYFIKPRNNLKIKNDVA